jgi:hypothetical protein
MANCVGEAYVEYGDVVVELHENAVLLMTAHTWTGCLLASYVLACAVIALIRVICRLIHYLL